MQGGVERTHKGVERIVDVMTKVVMDRSVLPPYVGDDLMDVGCETGMPIVGAAGYFFLQMVNLARQVLFQVIHGRDLLGDFSQVVAFRR